MTIRLKIKKLHPEAILPRYATPGAACFDLHWLSDQPIAQLPGGCVAVMRTGISIEVPEGYVLLVFSRSGHGFKNNVRLSNCVGVIDSDYRGELMIKLAHDGEPVKENPPLVLMNGDRIAQAMLVEVPRVEFAEVDELSATERGAGGFGSTGA